MCDRSIQEAGMLIELDSPLIPLKARGLARLHDAASMRIVCVTGTVWITLDGDTRDIVLSRGESFQVDRRAGVLLFALSDACGRVEAPAREARAGSRSPAWPVTPVRHALGAA